MSDILTGRLPECAVCGTAGVSLYAGLGDRLFGVPGSFSMSFCPVCGLHWLDPMPLESELHKCYKRYFSPDGFPGQEYPAGKLKKALRSFFLTNYLCGQYGYRHLHGSHCFCRLSGIFPLVPFLRKRLTYHWEAFFPRFKSGPGNLLVDVGCGRGEFLELMKRMGWEVLGIEYDSEGAAISRKKGIPVFEGTLEQAALAEASCHQVSLHHVIEHLHDPKKTIAECRRILEPGGRLVMRTPNSQSLAHMKFKENTFHLDPPRHLFVFSPESIRRMLSDAGFRKISVSVRPNSARSIYNRSSRIKELGRIDPREQVSCKGSRWFALREEFLCRRGRLCGEEIEAVGEK